MTSAGKTGSAMLQEGGDSMVFVKLWLVGLLVAVLFVAATPPSSAPITVKNEIPAQEQVPVVTAAQPCPDTATAQVAAAEERLTALVERNRQELKTEIAQAATSTTTAQVAVEERLTTLVERNRQELKTEIAQAAASTTAAQVAAAEERLTALVERDSQELKTEIAQAATSTTEVDQRLSQIEERLRVAESQAAERKADVESIRGAMVAPLVMTWVLTGLAAVVAVIASYVALRARRARGRSSGGAAKP